MSIIIVVTNKAVSSDGALAGDDTCCVPILAESEEDFGKMSLLDLLLKDEAEEMSLRRLPGVHRGTYITCDRKGHNCAVLQALPKCWCVLQELFLECKNFLQNQISFLKHDIPKACLEFSFLNFRDAYTKKHLIKQVFF